MTWRVELGHNFETAHRLSTPSSPKKCQSIHGHSWWAKVVIAGESLDGDGILVEFGAFKKAWRKWLDDHLDHALVVREGDPVIEALLSVVPDMRIHVLAENPTTEVLAKTIFEVSKRILHEELGVDPTWARVVEVHIQETRVNAASWSE